MAWRCLYCFIISGSVTGCGSVKRTFDISVMSNVRYQDTGDQDHDAQNITAGSQVWWYQADNSQYETLFPCWRYDQDCVHRQLLVYTATIHQVADCLELFQILYLFVLMAVVPPWLARLHLVDYLCAAAQLRSSACCLPFNNPVELKHYCTNVHSCQQVRALLLASWRLHYVVALYRLKKK